MTTTTGPVTGGVDTHGQTHHAAALDPLGRQLGDREFPTTPAGYRALLNWLRGHGELERVGIEGTGTYGAALTRHLRGFGVTVVEVDRPDRKARRAKGKSDPLDAYAAARAALAGTASGCPKTRDGRVEAIRSLRVARSSAVKARSQSTNQIKALLVTGPDELREQLRTLSTTGLIAACARLRPATDLADPEQATKTALRRLARRHQHLTEEITDADSDLRILITAAAPRLLALPGVGTEVAGQLLASAGDNPDRLRSEAAFAHLCGVAPIPAAADAPAATASTAAVTAPPTTPSTSSCSAGCATTPVPAPTPSDERPKACPNRRSSDASSVTSPARCSLPSLPGQRSTRTRPPRRCQRRLDVAAGAARYFYAFRPAGRPGGQLTASVTHGAAAPCSACNLQRSTLSKGQVGQDLPDTGPDPLGLLADAHHRLTAARTQLNAAITRARQHHITWTAIAVTGTIRQAAQQRLTQRH